MDSQKRFNSRTREGCDGAAGAVGSYGLVSIHAPGRGATRLRGLIILTAVVSIHAPGRGAT